MQETSKKPQVKAEELELFVSDEEYSSWIIARSIEEAAQGYIDEYGEDTYNDLIEIDPDTPFLKRFDRNQRLTITIDETDNGPLKQTKAIADWIKEQVDVGNEFPCLLARTEY